MYREVYDKLKRQVQKNILKNKKASVEVICILRLLYMSDCICVVVCVYMRTENT